MDVIYLNLLRAQARNHELTMVTLERTGLEREHAKELSDICPKIHFVTPPNTGTLVKRAAYRGAYSLASMLSGRPLPTFYDAPAGLRRLVESLTTEDNFDIVELHHSTCGALASHIRRGIKLLYMYDAHFRSWERRALTKSRFSRWKDSREAAKFRRFESRVACAFDAVLFGQDADRVAVAPMLEDNTFYSLMPNIVDTERFRPSAAEVEPNTVIFVGAMSHSANVDAVLHFTRAVWPLVRKRVPDARFIVVGASPPPLLRGLSGYDGITVHADVPDVRPYIEKAAVYAVPLRIGSGVKVKIIEALAMGKAIIGTSVAAEGMGLSEGTEIKVCALDLQFAEEIVSVLKSHECRNKLEAAGRAAALRLFSIEKGQRDLDAIYDRVAARVHLPGITKRDSVG